MALAGLLGLAAAGVSGGLVLVGMVTGVVALVALVRPRWAGLGSRKIAAVVGGSALIALIGGTAVADPTVTAAPISSSSTATSPAVPRATLPPVAPPPPSVPISPKPSLPASAAPRLGSALALVATLRVKGRAPKTGYMREKFGDGWQSTGGCSTRERVLRRDLDQVVVSAARGCPVVGGRLTDPYTGKTLSASAATVRDLDVEHVVALGDAWQKGAQQWTSDRRVAFANDLVELVVTNQSTNAAKGDGDAATWLPPNKAYRCAYVARQATVKAGYGLWVTPAERDSMVRVLSTCPQQPPLTAAAARTPTDATATVKKPAQTKPKPAAKPQAKPKPKPKPKPAPRPDVVRGVHPGAFCSEHDQPGVTVTGRKMKCTTTARDSRYRWRQG